MDMANWFTSNVEEYYASDKEKLAMVMSGNALNLFPRLRNTPLTHRG